MAVWRSEASMQLEFDELSVRSGGVGYGIFTGRASLDDFGDPVLIEIEPLIANKPTLSLDIGELVQERAEMRRRYGSAFFEVDEPRVRDLMLKWSMFHGLSESIKAVYKDEIGEFLLDRWSQPSIEQWA
jgi:hypothetical protein